MNVVQLFSTGVISGPEKMGLPGLGPISAGMAARGHDRVKLFYLVEERLPPECRLAGPRYAVGLGVSTDSLIRVRRRLDLGAVARLRAELGRTGARILHCHATKPSVLGCLAVRGTGIRLVTTIHGWGDRSGLSPFYDHLLYRLLPRFDRVVNVCRAEKDRLVRRGLDPTRVRVILNAAPDRYGAGAGRKGRGPGRAGVDPMAERFGLSSDRVRVATVSRLSPEKGIDRLLGAIARLPEPERPDCLVFGTGRCEGELRALADRLGLTGTVTFPGFVEDVDDLYPFVDVVAMPSLREGLPITLIEAAFAGRAILASHVGGIPELVEHDRSGLLVRPDDVEALAHGLGRLVRDRKLRTTLGREARRQALGRFTLERWAREHVELYEALA